MQKRQRTILITIGVVQAIGLLLTVLLGGTDLLLQTPLGALGIINFWGGLLTVFVGLLALIVPEARVLAQGILAAGGLMMLLGFALCSSA